MKNIRDRHFTCMLYKYMGKSMSTVSQAVKNGYFKISKINSFLSILSDYNSLNFQRHVYLFFSIRKKKRTYSHTVGWLLSGAVIIDSTLELKRPGCLPKVQSGTLPPYNPNRVSKRALIYNAASVFITRKGHWIYLIAKIHTLVSKI